MHCKEFVIVLLQSVEAGQVPFLLLRPEILAETLVCFEIRANSHSFFLDGNINQNSNDTIVDPNIQVDWQWVWVPLFWPRILPPPNFNGQITVTVTGYSLQPGSVTPANTSTTMTLTFTPVNDPPLVLSPSTVNTTEEHAVVISQPFPILVRDVDVNSTDDDQYPFMVTISRATKISDADPNFYWNYLFSIMFTAYGKLSLPVDPAVTEGRMYRDFFLHDFLSENTDLLFFKLTMYLPFMVHSKL